MYNQLPLLEIQELLAERYDEISLLEVLGINSFDLVERFLDRIEADQQKYLELLEDDSVEGYGDEAD